MNNNNKTLDRPWHEVMIRIGNNHSRFLEGLARRLGAEPTDEAVIAALNAHLDRLPRFFSCDSKGANK
jgi:hypothetical protein